MSNQLKKLENLFNANNFGNMTSIPSNFQRNSNINETVNKTSSFGEYNSINIQPIRSHTGSIRGKVLKIKLFKEFFLMKK